MTDQEVLEHYAKMVEMFNDIPDPEHYPRIFAYYVKLYNYYSKTESN